jgi:hypothetical protein
MRVLFLSIAHENDNIELSALIERIKRARALNRGPEGLGLNKYSVRKTLAENVNILSCRKDALSK